VLRRIFGPNRRELTGGWRQLCNEKLHGFIIIIIITIVGRNSAGAIATRYGLDDPMIESRCGATISASVKTGPVVHPASYTMGTGSFLGVKRPGSGIDYPPHLAPRLKKA
jgi:hypothetical protein